MCNLCSIYNHARAWSPSSDGAAASYFARFDPALMLMTAEACVCYVTYVRNMNTNQRYNDICYGASNGTDKDKQPRANLGRPPPNAHVCARSDHALLARPGSQYPAVADSRAGGLTIRAGGLDDSDGTRGDRRADHRRRPADWFRRSAVWAAAIPKEGRGAHAPARTINALK